MALITNLGYSIQAGKKQTVYSQKPTSPWYIEIHEWAEMLENSSKNAKAAGAVLEEEKQSMEKLPGFIK